MVNIELAKEYTTRNFA